MRICGIKLTHDGSIALIDDGSLVFCWEMEKLNNNERYSEFKDWALVEYILRVNGYEMQDIDKFVLDGWGEIGEISSKPFRITLKNGDGIIDLELASYGSMVINQKLLQPFNYVSNDGTFSYTSYMHSAGHLASAYCTSPFVKRGEGSFVLIWDGAMCPQLFYIDRHLDVQNLRPLFFLNGHIYSAFANRFFPFNKMDFDDMSIAGKVMAYIALGSVDISLLKTFNRIYQGLQTDGDISGKSLIDRFVEFGSASGVSSEAMMATFHCFIEELLVSSLREQIVKYKGHIKNLCFVGGCALNIKWNNTIRQTGLFDEMWVPPFPNDSGSSIGAACCEMLTSTKTGILQWDVYKGPALNYNYDNNNWNFKNFSIDNLASLIYSSNEPILFLNGRAELGPRALGNRSILCAATDKNTKATLNRIKQREDYRPIAPICLEENAKDIFYPGIADPFMLYDHQVKNEWKNRIPAICHLDGTARLQTVNRQQNKAIHDLLTSYKLISGIPVLCNTSANFNGKGFFPDIESAMKWNGVNFIWSEGMLYYKKGLELFLCSESNTDSNKSVNETFEIINF